MRQITIQDLDEFHKTKGRLPMQHSDEIVAFVNVALEYLTEKDEVVIMETGIHRGTNLVFMGEMLKKFYPKVFGIGIDLPNITKYAGSAVDPIQEVVNLRPKFDWKVVVGNSRDKKIIAEVKTLLAGRKVDLLFIDGDHSYDGCMADFYNYGVLVREGGVIGFHDLGENRFDVRTKVWPEIKEKYLKHWEFVFMPGRYGIGAIIKEEVDGTPIVGDSRPLDDSVSKS